MSEKIIELLKAILLGIIEGITEWLPVSSTGHMILLDELLSLRVSEEFMELFLVVIQLGAILAVPLLFFGKLWPFSKKKSPEEKKSIYMLWLKVIVGVIPAGVLGVLLDDLFDELFYNFVTVAITLVVYGVAFILVERHNRGREYRIESVYDLSFKDALVIGGFQCLSLIPGTSRSGSTILGGMLTGVSRTAASEFSFYMAIPIMVAASGLKILKFVLGGFSATAPELLLLIVGCLVSFVVSVLAIRFLVEFVRRHEFTVFGVYRIVLGVIVLGYFLISLI